MFLEAQKISREHSNQQIFNEATIGIAKIEYYLGNYEQSFQIADSIFSKIKATNKELIAQCHKLLGNDLVYMGKYAQAYDHQLKALEFFSSSGDKKNEALLYFSIGNNFFYQNQYKLALTEFKKADETWKKINDPQGRFWAMGAIGSVHEHLGNLNRAMDYSEQALAMSRILKSPADIAWSLYNVGSIATTSGELEKGIIHLSEAKNIAIELNDKPLLGYALEGLTMLHIRRGEYSKALKHLDESYSIASANNDIANLPNLYTLYSKIYYAKEDLKAYRKYVDKYIGLKDSLNNTELAQSMGDLKKDFETREYQRTQEIALLKKDKEIFESRQLTWIIVISFTTILFILLTIFMKINNKLAKEKNQILVSSNEKVIRQNELLKTSNEDLKKYAYIISHDLKEPLRNISSFTTLLNRSLGTAIPEKSKEYMSFIKNGALQMNNILNDLLAYSNVERISGDLEEINCKMVCTDLLKVMSNKLKEKNVLIRVGELPNVKMKTEHFQNIIGNLISNSIKFNQTENPNIYIECKLTANKSVFSVSDNGIGIHAEYFDKIFEVFQRLNNREQFQGSGIGLATCKKIVSDYGGEIWVESKPGIGSTFFFSIPKHIAETQKSSDKPEVILS